MNKPGSKFGIIRNALSCSQDQLATYLGITRGSLANVEINRRTMPDEAELRLLEIYQLILAAPVAIEPGYLPAKDDVSILQFEWQQKVQRQQKLVTAMSAKRTAAINSLSHASRMRQTLIIDARFDMFLRMLEAEAAVSINTITGEKIALEKLKLVAFEAALKAVSGEW